MLHRVQTLVIDASDQFLFANKDGQDLAPVAVRHLEAYVVEIARVPERHEVTLEIALLVDVAHVGEHSCPQSGLRDAAITPENNFLDDRRSRSCGRFGSLGGRRRSLWRFKLQLTGCGSSRGRRLLAPFLLRGLGVFELQSGGGGLGGLPFFVGLFLRRLLICRGL